MTKTRVLILLLLIPSAQFAQTSRAGKTSSTGEIRYFIRLFNCDDRCTAQINDDTRTQYSAGFGEDSGWFDVTAALRAGQNEVRFRGHNEDGAIAYGFQIRKNETMLVEKICGRAGALGCENNRTYARGIAKDFKYELETVSREEMELANRSWLSFYTAFRAAVNARDRAALRSMISSPYGDYGLTPDQVVKGLDRGRGWRELQRSVASGTEVNMLVSERGRPRRWTKEGWGIYFEFGGDGRWRWAGENVGD